MNLLSSVGNSCNVEFLIRSTFARFLADEALLCVAHLIIPESESEDIEKWNSCYLQSWQSGLDIICAMHPISVDYTQRKNSKNLVLVEIGGNLQPNGSEANMKGGGKRVKGE